MIIVSRLCSSLNSIDIPTSVNDIGEWCFAYCKSLSSITIPPTVTYIGNYCFANCSSINTVTCKTPTPRYGSLFEFSPIDQATLYVPEASLDAYKTTSPWSGFGTILPINASGIKNNTTVKPVTVDAVYDLDGKRTNGYRGINIIRMSDGTTKKVMK